MNGFPFPMVGDPLLPLAIQAYGEQAAADANILGINKRWVIAAVNAVLHWI